MKILILAALAACSLSADTLDGVTYTLQEPTFGPGSIEYTWEFTPFISGYTLDISIFTPPPDLQVFPTFGSITQESTLNETLFLTLTGSADELQACCGLNAIGFLSVEYQSAMDQGGGLPLAGLMFTSLTGVPEPQTIYLTALGFIGLFSMLAMRCLRNQRI